MSATLGFGYCMPDLPERFWPDAQVGETAVYNFDVTFAITNTSTGTVDPVIGATLETKPSGAGELTPTALTVANTSGVWLATATIKGGVAGRNYIHQLTLYSTAGQVIPILIGQVCDPVLFVPPEVPTPSPGFSAPITWGTVA